MFMLEEASKREMVNYLDLILLCLSFFYTLKLAKRLNTTLSHKWTTFIHTCNLRVLTCDIYLRIAIVWKRILEDEFIRNGVEL